MNQTLRWDGRPLDSPDYKGSRSTIGVETVDIGFATSPGMAEDDWIDAATPRHPVWVQRHDAHMGLANTEALRRAGVSLPAHALRLGVAAQSISPSPRSVEASDGTRYSGRTVIVTAWGE